MLKERVIYMSENLSEKTLKVKDVANLLQENPGVIRNWMRELKPYIPLIKDDNGYNLFTEEAIAVMKQIKEMHRDRNYSIKQIEHYFSTGGKNYIVVPDKTTEEVLAERLNDIEVRLENQEKFNETLLNRLIEQEKQFNSRLEERDKHIEQLQESKEAVGEEKEENENKKAWWKFWE